MTMNFTNKDEKVVDILIGMNLPRNLARTIVFFSKKDNCVCSEIQDVTKLRQPEVSMAMQTLKERGWIEIEPIHRDMKGRPMINYILIVPFDKIINTIIKEEQKKINNIKTKIRSLKKLTN